jgi:FAD-dependent oxidoreductase domain-containing protein 1
VTPPIDNLLGPAATDARRPGAVEVVIVGGAVIGSAIAYFLRSDPAFAGRVLVVEREPDYRRCATARSVGGIRAQFSTPENVAMSRFGMAFVREAAQRLEVDGEAPELGLRTPGYLFLATEAGLPVLHANLAVQRAGGAGVRILDRAGLRERFPWLAVDDLAGAAWGGGEEGWIDPYALLQALRRKARQLGAQYRTGEVVGVDRSADRVDAVRLADGARIPCQALVNAAGPWAGQVAGLAGVELPVRPRRRSVFAFACRQPLPGCPLTVDPTGLYFRPEGEQFLCGISPDPGEDPDSECLEVDHRLFEERLWPLLARRVPAFEAIKPLRSWAGLYDYNTFDQNAILGPHPELPNLFLANGFSGHGLQQSPAAGRAVAELIVHGGYRTLDLSRFRFERIAAGRPVRELNVV